MTTLPLDAQTPVGQWVRHCPATSRVFYQYGIDFCCSGKVALDQVCAKQGVPLEQIGREFQAILARPEASTTNLEGLSLTELCDTIVREHHDYLRAELPRLTQMLEKVCRVHGDHHPWLRPLQVTFTALCDELMPHLWKEENILFPALRQMEQTPGQTQFHFGTLDQPIQMMEHEHDSAGSLLAQMRQLSNDYAIPPEACNTFRALLQGLCDLERDMHQHVHRENHILFVRALERVQRLESACPAPTA